MTMLSSRLLFRCRSDLVASRFMSSRFCTSSSPYPSSQNPKSDTSSPPAAITKTPATAKPRSSDIAAIFRENNPDRLVTRILELTPSSHFRRLHLPYLSAIHRLARSGRPDAVAAILEPLKLYPADISREGFALRLISLYGRAGIADRAAATFQELPSLGCRRTVTSFNTLLTALVDAGEPERALEAFLAAPADYPDITRDLVSYNVFVRALCEMGEIDAALKEMSTMEVKGIVPDIVTLNTLLRGCYQHARYDDAEKTWAAISDRGLQPDQRSYTEKMLGLMAQGLISEALETYGEMKNRGIEPNAYTYNALIAARSKNGDLDGARKVFAEMKKRRCPPNARTFEVLIPAVCDAGELGLAFHLAERGLGHSVDAGVLQLVVDALVKGDRVGDAKKLVEFGWRRVWYREKLKMPTSLVVDADDNDDR